MNKNISLLASLLLFFAAQTAAGQEVVSAPPGDPFGAAKPVADTLLAEPSPMDTLQDRFALDTLPTRDKYVKIVVYDDYTWCYIDEGRPVIDTTGFYDGWNSEMIHAFRGTPLDSLPDEIDICLTDSLHGYCAPITGRISSGFKFRRTREHQGIDIPLSVGDTIRAAFDGIVRYTGVTKKTGGYGNLVIIRHPNGLETYYGHLSRILVAIDEPVKAGEVIGLGGSTGRSTGPHLHFETRYYGKPFDPERIMDFSTGEVRDSILTLKKHYFSIYSHYGQTDNQSKHAAGAVYYKVRKGDNLGKIARRHGTTVNNICKLNRISSRKTLRVGQRLRVK